MRTSHFILGLASAAALATTANAAQISGLWNTGVDSAGVELGDGNSEIHYLVNGSATPITYQHPLWYDATDAHWISVFQGGGYNSATNVYTLTFDLTGLDATTAAIQGLFSTDDYGSVSLNGGGTTNQIGNYTSLTSFSFTSGFVAGINTLSFTVVDTGGVPSGLLVSGLSGTADVATSPAPEPASWALMVMGFGALGLAMRRRPKASVTFA